MTVKFATNPIGWTNDDLPGLGQEITLETCMKEARKAGFEGIEMGGKFPQKAEELGSLLSSHDLVLASGWWEGSLVERGAEAEFDAMQDYLMMLKELGVDTFIYGEGSRGRLAGIWKPISGRPVLADDEWDTYAKALTDLAEKTKAIGMQLALHPHMGTLVETDAEIDRIMSLVGPTVALAFDTGHCVFSGGNPADVIRTHGQKIVHLHCKDVRTDKLNQAIATDMSFMDSVLEGIFTVPGDGGIDYGAIFDALKEADYKGWLVVEAEQNPEKAPPFFFAKLGYQNLYSMAVKAGLTV